jgi:carboxymethylenebutenolidase
MCHQSWAGAQASAGTTAAGTTVAGITVERTGIQVADGLLPCLIYRAGSDGGRPCVLVPDIYGPVPFYQEVARRLAAAGHPTALIDIFWREGPLAELTRDAAFGRRSGMDETMAIGDTSSAVDYMRARFGGARTGVLGFCLGGTIALVLASARQDLAVVSYYGFPEGIAGPVRVPAPRPVDLAGRMNGPILAFWGAADYIGAQTMDRFAAAMTAGPAHYGAHIYPDAGHGFLQGLVEERPDSAAAADSWRKTLSFFAINLGDRSS